MAECNTTRQQCTSDQVFSAVANSACVGQHVGLDALGAEQLIYDQSYNDLINSFGIEIDYYINTTDLIGADMLYGEQPTAIYYGPIPIKMYIEIENEAITLQSFGFNAADDFTGYVHIKTFEDTLSSRDLFVRTISGDILPLDEWVEKIVTEESEVDNKSLYKFITQSGDDIVMQSGESLYTEYIKYLDLTPVDIQDIITELAQETIYCETLDSIEPYKMTEEQDDGRAYMFSTNTTNENVVHETVPNLNFSEQPFVAQDFTIREIEHFLTEGGSSMYGEAARINALSALRDQQGTRYTMLNNFIETKQGLEPKSGDLMDIVQLGCDRPGGRCSKIFEVTERMDQDLAGGLNPLLGHYVWRIRGKRYEPSFEPGAPQECKNEQVYDNKFSGVSETTLPTDDISADKSYPGNITEKSKDIYDMSVNDTDIYGNYY